MPRTTWNPRLFPLEFTSRAKRNKLPSVKPESVYGDQNVMHILRGVSNARDIMHAPHSDDCVEKQKEGKIVSHVVLSRCEEISEILYERRERLQYFRLAYISCSPSPCATFLAVVAINAVITSTQRCRVGNKKKDRNTLGKKHLVLCWLSSHLSY